VYTGQQALANGLVDQLGTVDDAIALARKTAGVTKCKVVMYHRPLGWRANAYSALPGPGQINLLNITVPNLLSASQPQFLYLWAGQAGAGGGGL
jgi:ClpP class serine protease